MAFSLKPPTKTHTTITDQIVQKATKKHVRQWGWVDRKYAMRVTLEEIEEDLIEVFTPADVYSYYEEEYNNLSEWLSRKHSSIYADYKMGR